MAAKSRRTSRKPVVPVRGVHLDLKGTPPTFKRLLRLLDIAAAAKYNALLVEWEDMFPWTVHEGFRLHTAYTPREVTRFCGEAEEKGLEIIPLVQCLGHMETPLSVPDFAHLRELPWRSDGLNPLAPGARELVEAMIDDVLALTPNVRYFHLGGDEARTLGRADETARFVKKHGKGALYLKHVNPILAKLAAQGIRPILWSDMMHKWPVRELKRIARKADLCPWGYHDHPDTFRFHSGTKYIKRFADSGVTLWGAAAYKGGTEHNEDLCDFDQQTRNSEGWADVARRYGLVGLFATAWSRFSTHRTQCEPIDACLDSLVNVGFALTDGKSPGRDACLKVLKRLGELKRFEKCRAALADLQSARAWAWREIQTIREQIVVETAEPERRESGIATEHLVNLRRHVFGAEAASLATRKALRGLMQPYWVERYLEDRIEALREEHAVLDARVRVLEPEQYVAGLGVSHWNPRH
ncbi:MAG: family 20 glycosylhydrolase [Planctomycetota bacterium]|jgi:hexosaminidase